MSIKTPQNNHVLSPVFISLFCSGLRVHPQAGILECVAVSFSGGFSQPWARTQVSLIAGGPSEPPDKPPFINTCGGKKIYCLSGKVCRQRLHLSLFIAVQSKVLNLLSESHLPSVRIEGLSRYLLRWQVSRAFELQLAVTASVDSTISRP